VFAVARTQTLQIPWKDKNDDPARILLFPNSTSNNKCTFTIHRCPTQRASIDDCFPSLYTPKVLSLITTQYVSSRNRPDWIHLLVKRPHLQRALQVKMSPPKKLPEWLYLRYQTSSHNVHKESGLIYQRISQLLQSSMSTILAIFLDISFFKCDLFQVLKNPSKGGSLTT
jgi:hypothetical protein